MIGLAWLSALISVLCLTYPLYVIRPFRAQGEAELQLALLVMEWRVWMAPVALVACGYAAYRLWRAKRRWLPIGTLVLAAAGTVGSRVNVFEKMFHPIDEARFLTIATAHLDERDRVLAIERGGAARAYPVANLAYHHLVNDALSGHPVVATY